MQHEEAIGDRAFGLRVAVPVDATSHDARHAVAFKDRGSVASIDLIGIEEVNVATTFGRLAARHEEACLLQGMQDVLRDQVFAAIAIAVGFSG